MEIKIENCENCPFMVKRKSIVPEETLVYCNLKKFYKTNIYMLSIKKILSIDNQCPIENLISLKVKT